MRFGQKAFTSIEITENFAGTGEAYLTGLGATNNPAALGVEQLKFSARDKLYSEQITTVFTEEKPKPSFFSLFKRQEPDMKPDQAATFQAQLDAMAQKLSAFEQKKLADDAITHTDAEKYSALEKEVGDLKTENAALKVSAEKHADEYALLKAEIDTFAAKLKDALQEQPGTKTEENSHDDLKAYI
jgi:hypothetical protein